MPSSKASVLRCSAFFPVQLSHPYMTTGKIRALTRRTLCYFFLFCSFCLKILQSFWDCFVHNKLFLSCCFIFLNFSYIHLLEPEDLVLFKPLFIIHLYKSQVFCFPFIFISWRLITSQHCSGFCHTLT